MQTGIKHKPNIKVRVSQSLTKFFSFCLHNFGLLLRVEVPPYSSLSNYKI